MDVTWLGHGCFRLRGRSAAVVTEKYESYILKELIPDVQKRFRTIEARYGRGIAGLSMGGYGALKFGLKSPENFAFAGSLSGALSAASWTEDDLKTLKSIRDSVFDIFGPVGSETRKKNDIYEIVRALPAARVAGLPYFYLDCGTEDFLTTNSQQFAALLREKKVLHEYRELPGDHNWAYWDQQVQEVLKVAASHLRMPKEPGMRKTRVGSRFALNAGRDEHPSGAAPPGPRHVRAPALLISSRIESCFDCDGNCH